MRNKIRINFDAACWNKEGHRQHMGIGVSVVINNEYREDLSRAVYIYSEEGTNNVAEWIGCMMAMEIAYDLYKFYAGECHIMVFSDSQVISNQYNGTYSMNPKFQTYYNKAKLKGKAAGVPVVNWVPREKNTKADELSKEGLHLLKPKQ